MRRLETHKGNQIMYLGYWDVNALRNSRKYVDAKIFEEGSIKSDFKEESGEYAITFPENIEEISKMRFILDRRDLDVLPLKDVRHRMGEVDAQYKDFKAIAQRIKSADATISPEESQKLCKMIDVINIYSLEDFFVEGQKPPAERNDNFALSETALDAQFSGYVNSLLEYVFIRSKKEKEDGPVVSAVRRYVLSMRHNRK